MNAEQTAIYRFLGELAQELDNRPTKMIDMSSTGLAIMGLAMEYCKLNTHANEEPMTNDKLASSLADIIKASNRRAMEEGHRIATAIDISAQ